MSLQLYRIDQVTGARLLRDETAVYEAITTRSNCDLGPCWPGLHVMLTGGDPPMPRYIALQQELDWDDDSFENVLMGGDPTQYEDALGFARYLAPSIVRTFGARLGDLSLVDFVERFDDDVLEYLPTGWDVARARPELAARFGELVACYRVAASSGDGLLFTLREVGMKRLIRVGFYRELKHGKPDGESLHAVLQPRASADDALLVRYLRAGKPMITSPSMVRDVIAGNALIGSLEIRTDGAFAWPSDLPYYVEKHHARLPDELVQHARSLNFSVPDDINLSKLELG